MAPRMPRGSSANLRTKVVALLVSLTALWVFAAWVTLREGTNLLFAQALNSSVYEPSEPLLQGLQNGATSVARVPGIDQDSPRGDGRREGNLAGSRG